MGLTIHYRFKTPLGNVGQARECVRLLRERATQLPFQEVFDPIEFFGQSAVDADVTMDDPNSWIKIQALRPVPYMHHGETQYQTVAPTELIGFCINPGEGCEPANIGLCRYPEMVTMNGRSRKTRLEGWSWGSFCKTQYASNPNCGGVDNFLRCHTSVVALLDYADELGILDGVTDESKYYEHRDRNQLAEEIERWNQMIAGFYGVLKDKLGDALPKERLTLDAEIAHYPNFEHLEAKARQSEPK